MTRLMLRTYNQYAGLSQSADEVAQALVALPVFPLPDKVAPNDWRVHVPMQLLEGWRRLSDDERVAVYVMAQSATHPFEMPAGEDPIVFN